MRALTIFLLAFACLAIFPLTADAQAVVNPTTAEYTPSPDHSLIVRYEIGYFYGGATEPFFVSDFGKPACSPLCSNPLPAKPAFGEFTAKIKAWAVDYGGVPIASEWSPVSNPFGLLPLPPGATTLKK